MSMVESGLAYTEHKLNTFLSFFSFLLVSENSCAAGVPLVSAVTAVAGVDCGYWHLCCCRLSDFACFLLLQESCCCRGTAVAGVLLLQKELLW